VQFKFLLLSLSSSFHSGYAAEVCGRPVRDHLQHGPQRQRAAAGHQVHVRLPGRAGRQALHHGLRRTAHLEEQLVSGRVIQLLADPRWWDGYWMPFQGGTRIVPSNFFKHKVKHCLIPAFLNVRICCSSLSNVMVTWISTWQFNDITFRLFDVHFLHFRRVHNVIIQRLH